MAKHNGSAKADNLKGGRRSDTLHGKDGDDKISGGSGSGSDKLYGDNGNDSINGGSGSDKLYGGAGNDSLYGGKGSDKLYGGDGNDYLNGGRDRDTLYGDNGDDTLNGDLGDDKLYGGAGNDTLIGGAGRDYLNGGDGDDTYVFTDASGSDTIDDAYGVNKLDFSNTSSDAWFDFTSGMASNRNTLVSFNNISVVQGGSGNNLYILNDTSTPITIIGGAGNDTLDLSHVSQANLANITATGIENYIGGTLPGNNNSPSPSPAPAPSPSGGGGTTGTAGDDTFSFGNNFTTQSIDGLGGTDTIDFSARTTGNPVTVNYTSGNDGTATNNSGTITFVSVENAVGGADDDSFVFTNSFGTHTLDGGAGNDTIDLSASQAGNNISTDFAAGTITNGSDTLTFSNVEHVTTGAGDDDFSFGTISGTPTVDGGSGTDTLNFSSETSNIVVDFQSGGSGDIAALNIETVVAGAGDDTFMLVNNFASHNIDGSGGTNTLDFSALSSGHDLTVDFSNSTATSSSDPGTITFSNIQNIVAGAGDDQLILTDGLGNQTLDGGAGNDTLDWSASGSNISVDLGGNIVSNGSDSVTINNIENISTGSGDDTFSLSDISAHHTLDGNGGNDSLDLSSLGASSGATIGFASSITGTNITALNMESVTGGAGNDTFSFADGFTDHTIDGGTGDNTLNFASMTSGNNVTVDFGTSQANNGGTGIISFSNIIDVVSGAGDDNFVFGDLNPHTIDGGAGSDSADLSALSGGQNAVINLTGGAFSGTTHTFTNVESITTGGGDDTFALGNNFNSVTVDGGAGNNTLDFSSMTSGNNLTLDLTTNTATNNIGSGSVSLSNMQNIIAGAGNDHITVGDGYGTITVDGGTGTDTLDLSAVTGNSTIDFNGGNITTNSDVLTFSNMENILGGQGDDTYQGILSGFGSITINDAGGTNDYLDLSNFSQGQVTAWQSSGDTLMVQFSTGDAISIEHYFNGNTSTAGAGQIETFHFSDADLQFNDITYT